MIVQDDSRQFHEQKFPLAKHLTDKKLLERDDKIYLEAVQKWFLFTRYLIQCAFLELCVHLTQLKSFYPYWLSNVKQEQIEMERILYKKYRNAHYILVSTGLDGFYVFDKFMD